MTREFIEQLDVVEPNCFETNREEIWYKVGLVDGLNIADENPNLEKFWHDVSEEPRCEELLLGEDTDGFNKDYTYCFGFCDNGIPARLCKNCRRLRTANQAPIEGIWWYLEVDYIPEIGRCHRYEPKW